MRLRTLSPQNGETAQAGDNARRIANEAGFAVPTVLLALVAAFGLASVTVVASVSSQRGTVRDQDTKAAIAAAEAGITEALLHYNRIPTATGATCLVGYPVAPAPPTASGWCSAVNRLISGVPGASFTYWVRPTASQTASPTPDQVEIVSQGAADGITRRVEMVARSSGGLQPFADANVIGLNFLWFDSDADVAADVATNGDMTLEPSSTLDCTYAQVGVGHVVDIQGSAQMDCAPHEGSISLPPVNQGDVPPPTSNNSNGRFFGSDTYTGPPPSWDPTTRELALTGATTKLTLGGGNYSLCTLRLNQNTSLFIAPSVEPDPEPLRIYFDSPDSGACNLPNDAVQLHMEQNTDISSLGGRDVHLLFAGSSALRTQAVLASNTQVPDGSCEQDFVLYGPRTDVTLRSNSTFCGAMAGRSITLSSQTTVLAGTAPSEFELPNTVAPHYVTEEFVECRATNDTTVPDAGC